MQAGSTSRTCNGRRRPCGAGCSRTSGTSATAATPTARTASPGASPVPFARPRPAARRSRRAALAAHPTHRPTSPSVRRSIRHRTCCRICTRTDFTPRHTCRTCCTIRPRPPR
uniref:(northern house mosquito) hypothetical protein n=1 Tax=Culex pipiens TaxID=7175 RepID=A0A8D8H0P6_CULPI